MPRRARQVFVYNKTKETFLAFRVDVADSILGRLVGLLGKRSLKPDSGVWIVPANAVHTVGMLFTFDLVLIDKDFTVVAVRELVRPFRVTRPIFRAESVLELPAHAIFRSRTEVGDQLVIERYEARQPTPSDSADTPIDPQGTGEDLVHSSPVTQSAEAAFTKPAEFNQFAALDCVGDGTSDASLKDGHSPVRVSRS
jgi:uncharacterized membrane protein (UPF0127 family)